MLFVNSLPLGVIELKNPADEDATIWTAWQQLQTYRAELPTLFSMNEALMVSDGAQARVGALTAGREWFKPWRTRLNEPKSTAHEYLRFLCLLCPANERSANLGHVLERAPAPD